MTSAGNLEGLIPIAGGIYGLCIAFGVIEPSRNPESSRLWRERYGGLMMMLGPCVIGFGIVRLCGWL